MAIKIKFDLVGNPEPPTIILANRNGNKLGQLKVNADSIELVDKFNDASEISFTINKYIDDKLTPLWEKVVDFKLIYCKEWDAWFEIKVELDEETETVKTVFCTQLGQAELSQIMLYNIEINTEKDIERDDYKISILYDPDHPEASILNRILKDKAPHYSITYVSPTIAKIQRSFSFDGTSILYAFQEIAEEIGCLFQFDAGIDENGRLQRKISVYDLQQHCNDCGHRGEYTDKCPKCGSTNIISGYGDDTLIFVTSDELASEGIELVTDTDSVKNCFKLEAGDDLMTATIRNCNPNGTEYIWHFSDAVKEDMSDELVEKIESYDELYKNQYNNKVSNVDSQMLGRYNNLVDKYSIYNKDLQKISTPIIGYANLMNANYNTIDMALFLKSTLMPSVEISETNAKEQASLLTASSLSPVAVADIDIVSLATANSAVLAMAKIIVKSTFKAEIKSSELTTSGNKKYWKGSFIVTNYSDEEDFAESNQISVELNDDLETVTKQKIEKLLTKENTDDLSITGLFEKEYDDFCRELKKYALNPLISFHDACQACIDILIDQGVADKNTWSDNEAGSEGNLYEKLYLPYYNKLQAIEAEIKIREDEISIILGVYDNDGNLILDGLQTNIEECRNEIQKALDFKSYLGEELWLDFCAYRREDTYSNDNYISDGLNNAELFKNAQEFIEIAENEIYKSAELQHSISTTLNNLLAIEKFKPLVDSFENGNWIRVQVDDQIYKLRLIEYDVDFGSFEKIPVEFSDVTKAKNGVTDVESILSQASSMATSYDSVKRQSAQGDNAQGTINQWLTSGLNSALVRIQNNDDEDIVLNRNGLLCRSYDDITETYAPEQFRLTHNIMAYTTDNWRTVSAALGKHDYIYYDSNKVLQQGIDYGFTAKFVQAGYVNGSQIIGGEIYSQNYTSATGTYINLNDGSFSWAGGKLKYDGNKISLKDVKIVWESTNDIPTSSVTGLDNIIENLDNAINEAEQNAKEYADTKDSTLKTSLTSAYQKYADSKVSELDTAVGKYLGLSGSTLIGSSYIISPYIAGGYLNITNTSNNSRVIIDPNNLTGNGYIFQVHNGTKVSMGITKDGSASFEGKITATSGKIAGWDISGSSLLREYTSDDITRSVFMQGYGTDTNNAFAVRHKTSSDTSWTYDFYVRNDGYLKATNADITGKITASSGSITGNLSVSGSLTHTRGNYTVTLRAVPSTVTNGVFYITDKSSGSNVYPFIVNGDGSFKATKATITGDSTFGGTLNAADGTFKGRLSAVSGTFTSLSAGKSSFSKNQVIIDASYTDSNGDEISKGSIYIGRSGVEGWEDITIRPSSDNLGNIGTAGKSWDILYVKNGAIQSSDRNYKTDVSKMGEKQERLFNLLTPVTFKFIDSTYDRFHYGFISQEVEDAIIKSGLTTQDFAGFCKDIKRDENGLPMLDEDGNQMYVYSLRYNEFIALNTHMIQKLQAENQELKERIDSLESMLKQLQ